MKLWGGEHNEQFFLTKALVTDCANCGDVKIMSSSECQ
jgi:hypothetical protein